MAKISVLIPLFNREHYIARAIKSVLKQSFKDWELVIVDDGSSDGSVDIVESLMRVHPKRIINLVELPNNIGCAGATKIAIEYATSPLCTILGSDDRLTPNSLETIVQFFKTHSGVGFMWTRYLSTRDGSSWWEGRSKALPRDLVLKQALLQGWWGALAQQSFRRRKYFKTQGLNPNIRYVMDQQLASLFAMKGIPSVHHPVITYRHYQHPSQMSSVHYEEQQKCRGIVLQMMGGEYVREV